MLVSFFNLVTIFLGIANFILGFFIFWGGRRRADTVVFFILTFFVAIWIFGLVVFSATKILPVAYIAAHIFYLAAALIPTGLVYFSLIFPSKKFKPHLIRDGFIAITTFIIVLISAVPGILFEDVILNDTNTVILKNSYNFYTLYFFLFGLWAFINLTHTFQQAKGVIKTQVKLVLLGIASAFSFGVFFNLILPLLGNYQFILIGPYFTIVMISLFAYAIARHGLMNVRLLATEFFSTLILVLLLADLFTARSLEELIIKFIIFVVILVFSILLIRGTLREIRALQDLSEAKSEFISIASHQLRTPLSIIKGYISMMTEGTYGDMSVKQLDTINKIYITNEGMLRLVNDLLSVSRAEKGELQYLFEKIDIRDIINTVVTEFSLSVRNKNLTLNSNVPETPFFVLADKDKLKQAIMNLLDNAIKYTETGGIVVLLSGGGATNKYVRIYIKDTGIGLNQNEIENIFQKFERSDRGGRINAGGSGLGLYIAKRIISDHKGRIWVESEGKNRGSTFIIELPLITALAKDEK